MASIEFDEVFSRFYLRVEDYKIAGLEEEIANEMLFGYMKSTISKPFIRRLFSSIVMDQDVEEIEYTMRESWGDVEDQDFVEELLALGMVVQWLSPQYHSMQNTSQFFSNSDLKFFSQANHMAELKEMYQKAQTDLRKYIRDRGYSVSLVNGVE